MTRLANEIVAALTAGERKFLRGRHSDTGNPWPFISMSERAGGAKNRLFERLKRKGLYNRGNEITILGAQVRALLS